MKKIILMIGFLSCMGCAGATGNTDSKDPVERGLSYVAAAIVTHGILQIIFRK